MKLLLIRHGETKENKSGIILGHEGGELSQAGVESVKRLSRQLRQRAINKVYCSDLKRCTDTADILFKDRKLDINLRPGLREINFGDFQGKPHSAIPENYLDSPDKKFPNGESNFDFIKRVIDTINIIFQNNQTHTVAIICHSGTISAINAANKKNSFSEELKNKAEQSIVYEITMKMRLSYPA